MVYFTIQQLETFFAIVEYHSLSNAARELYVSQPSLSKTLSRLEESLGVILFSRGSGTMTLTREGEMLYGRLKSGYRMMAQAISEARDSQNGQSRSLRIGLHTSCERSNEFNSIWDIVDAYERTYPEVSVTEELLEYSELRSALLDGEMDVIITHSFALKNVQNIEMRRLRKLKFYIAMSSENPLAQGDALDFSVLNNEPFIFISSDVTKMDMDFCLERLHNAGINSKNVIFMHNARSAAMAVVRNKGMMLTCHSHGFTGGEIKLFPALEPPVETYFVCAWQAGQAKREVRDFLRMLPGLDQPVRRVPKPAKADGRS